MNKTGFVKRCDDKLKLVRTEYGFSQDKMAQVLGFSKKTIVEIEKGRSSLGFSGGVTLCTIFTNSETLAATFGGRPNDVIMALAFEGDEPVVYPKTMGGKVWWRDVFNRNGYKIQKNIISQHYRVLDPQNRRICSAFKFRSIKRSFLQAVRQTDPKQ